MSHAEKCPVCTGTGKYMPPPDPTSNATPQTRDCHGCGGKGWVEVQDCSWSYRYYWPSPTGYFQNGWLDQYGNWHPI